MGENVFYTNRHDNKLRNSVDDREFLSIIDEHFHMDHMDARGYWTSQLPFKSKHPSLKNSKSQVLKRTINLDQSLKKNPNKLPQMCDLMKDIFDTGAAERGPVLSVLVPPYIWSDAPEKAC